jgi:hypothetical protein
MTDQQEKLLLDTLLAFLRRYPEATPEEFEEARRRILKMMGV